MLEQRFYFCRPRRDWKPTGDAQRLVVQVPDFCSLFHPVFLFASFFEKHPFKCDTRFVNDQDRDDIKKLIKSGNMDLVFRWFLKRAKRMVAMVTEPTHTHAYMIFVRQKFWQVFSPHKSGNCEKTYWQGWRWPDEDVNSYRRCKYTFLAGVCPSSASRPCQTPRSTSPQPENLFLCFSLNKYVFSGGTRPSWMSVPMPGEKVK